MRSLGRWWNALTARIGLVRRSHGVLVRKETITHIRDGNAARRRQDWGSAANAYRCALAFEPHLQHIWVQLGHMEKEAGAIDRAAVAYAEAGRLQPGDALPFLHLGHMAKGWRPPMEAAGHFVVALRRSPGNMEAISELVRLLPDPDDVDPSLWTDILDVLEIDPAERDIESPGHLPTGAIVFDVTDLLAFFGQHRLPTGIQRVQIEVSLACLKQAPDVPAAFCVYSSARRGWIRLSHASFENICHLARKSDDVFDPVWIAQLDRTYRHIAVSRTANFPDRTTLINLGASWSDRNYLLDVRIARVCQGLIYIPFVHDLIPLIGPEWCMDTLARDYRAWFGSLLHSADAYLTNSETTRTDLLRVANEWGTSITASSVAVIRLDGDFRRPAAPTEFLTSQGLTAQTYVLFVSTLEPRKNHLGAFRAWALLADRIGEEKMPNLVCVGGRGWLNEDLYDLLRKRPRVRRLVRILHGVPDDGLATLYEHCLFALYPSFYEGWGLPVSEALSYGKVPAISCVSSLPEAGGTFARYFDPTDVQDIATTVLTLLGDEARTTAEDTIHEGYRPRSWDAIAHDVIVKAQTVTFRATATLPCLTGPGQWTLALPRYADDVEVGTEAVQGEVLRHGRAWQSPGLNGSQIRGDDATLRFRWAGGRDIALHIHFAATVQDVEVRVAIADRIQTCRIQAHAPAMIACKLPEGATTLNISIVPHAGEIVVERVAIVHESAV